MEDMELWTSYSSQIVALVTIVTAMLGLLLKREILRRDDVNAVFRFAERHLPATARPVGANLLTHMRMMAEVAAQDREPGKPGR